MFLSQLGLYWEEIKIQGSNYNLSRNLITKFQNLSDQTENDHFTSQNNSLFITFFITLGKPFQQEEEETISLSYHDAIRY
jgi:hypothetical protein